MKRIRRGVFVDPSHRFPNVLNEVLIMLDTVKSSVQLKDMSLFRQQCYINGAWVDADDKSTLTVYNPADGTLVGTVPKMGTAETRRAIETAHEAFKLWRAPAVGRLRPGARRVKRDRNRRRLVRA